MKPGDGLCQAAQSSSRSLAAPTCRPLLLLLSWSRGGGSREQWAWGFSAHLAAFAREAIPKHPVGVIGTSRTPV